MLYLTLTWINLCGGIFTIVCLVNVIRNYFISPRMGFYILLCIASMLILIATQAYQLTTNPGVPWLKALSFYVWMKTLYFTYAVRFTSIRNDGKPVKKQKHVL